MGLASLVGLVEQPRSAEPSSRPARRSHHIALIVPYSDRQVLNTAYIPCVPGLAWLDSCDLGGNKSRQKTTKEGKI